MKKIRILCEKACAESIWCKQLFSGLVKELKKRRIGFEQDGDISKEDIAECYAQVVGLEDAGKLFAPDTFEPMAGQLKQKTAGVV